MLPQFGVIGRYVNVRRIRKVSPEGSTLLFLHQVTAVVLFAFCILVSSLQYFGKSIQCVQDKKEEDAVIDENVMNSFCFISGTYTLSRNDLGCEEFIVGPGVGPDADDYVVQSQSYYVWVPFVLFFQALTFLVPHCYWSYHEDGLAGKLLGQDLNLESASESGRKIRNVALYFRKRLGSHGSFSFAWIITDLLALVVVVGNLFLTNSFLGDRFFTYGPRILGLLPSNCGSPADDVFPKMTKCTFHKFGPGGGLQNFDSLCVMALNVVNEKIYAALWFWFFILAPITCAGLLMKLGTITLLGSIPRRILSSSWLRTIVGVPAAVPPSSLLTLPTQYFRTTDWVFFAYITAGMGPVAYNTFATHLRELFEEEEP